MLIQLAIRNLGIIERLDLELGPGLRVITGETGVGKSLLLRSIDLLRGARGKSDWIRRGEEEAQVAGCFRLDDAPGVRAIEELTGIEPSDGELLVERRLRRSGRGRCRLNGREIPVSLLRQAVAGLIEVQSQASQLMLLEPARQLELVDRYADLTGRRHEFREAYRKVQRLAREIEDLAAREKERHDRRLLLEHVVSELESAQLQKGERQRLETELELVSNRERLAAVVTTCLDRIYEGESSVLDQISEAAREVSSLGIVHPSLDEFLAGCEQARVALDEGVRRLREMIDEVETDPGRLDELQSRLDVLSALEERHRRRGDELLRYRDERRSELASMDSEDERRPELEGELEGCIEELEQRSRSLTRRRRHAATRLGDRVREELRDLGLGAARFEVQIHTSPGREGWRRLTETGSDRCDFSFGANPGEALRSLREVASGGELSRVMLSLKRVLAERDRTPTVVFDEIDAGVGGRLGMTLGRKLRQIAAHHQVVCVTHLPQVASFASGHYRVVKRVSSRRTTAGIEMLEGEPRVREIAIMIRGEQHSESSLAEAREMIEEAAR